MTDMHGKTCIVTGSNSGIGKETALALAEMGATVIMAVRNLERGQVALDYILQEVKEPHIELMQCDVASKSSIESFASEFKSKFDSLHVLVNNAGAVFSKRQVTEEGFERTLAVNYLGPLLLTRELLPLLKSGVPSRVINLCSGLYKSGQVVLDDLQSEKKYSSQKVYRNTKLLLLMHTYSLAKKLEGSGVTVNAVLPGFVATNLGKNSGSRMQDLMFGMMKPFQLSPMEGAETSVYVSSSSEVDGLSGKCFSKKQVVTTTEISNDITLQKQLWTKTFEILGITDH
ncbi:SDR family NAD(P)-dependent oxidoreductase [Candidatus Thorarchaeota archaeon]|nr:MAG: SDR family NAD(P)-dependent oxidoreductase [Candidatus Thorarchaeota archaeon]